MNSRSRFPLPASRFPLPASCAPALLRSCASTVGLLCGFLLSTGAFHAQTVAPPVHYGFEEPDFSLGNIHGQRGWSVEQGKAEVVEDQAHIGKRALKLFPADPFSQAKLTLAPGVPPSTVMFLDFYVIPAACAAVKQEEFLDIDGARIGLFSEQPGDREAVVHFFHGDAAGSGAWLSTGLTVTVQNADGSRPWVRLTLREDFARQTWDLWVDGQPAVGDAVASLW